jgi:type IV pilus assembly protein PilP
VASETLTGRAARARRRAALAMAIAATLALAGCEQVKEVGRMVGLGGEEPQPTPQPQTPRPRPPAAVARPAPSGPAAQVAAARMADPRLPSGAAPAQPARTAVAQAPAPPAPGGLAAAAASPPPVPPAAVPAAAVPPAAVPPAAVPAASPAGAPAAAQPQASPAAVGLTLASAEEPYDPTGKRDPFRPYLTAADLAARKAREQLTPLQRLELSQIKLVAIVWGLRSNHAMVEDSGGIGYVLTVGTKVGTNGGRVARIAPDAVYIEESFRDATGAVLTNQVTLRLPAAAGGRGS